jgi:hypothetical protein
MPKLDQEYIRPDLSLNSLQNLTPEQTAALSQAQDLLDEVLRRLISRDIHTAVILLSDLRNRIDAVQGGDRGDSGKQVPPPRELTG